MKPYSALAVANEFLDLAGGNHDLTPMKLMKLVFLAHGWNYGFHGDSLINEVFQAWKYGPVSQSLYEAVRKYGDDPVTEPLTVVEAWNFQPMVKDTPKIDPCDSESRSIIRMVWESYGELSAVRLSRITHEQGTPWWDVNKKYGGNIPRWEEIPEDSIRNYYEAKMKEDGNG